MTKKRLIDSESGLSYTIKSDLLSDVSSNIRTKVEPKSWFFKTRGTDIFLKNFKHNRGAGSLQDMAWRCLLSDRENINSELLQNLNWELAFKIWQKLNTNDLICIYVWQEFIKAHAQNILKESRRNAYGLVTYETARLPLHTNKAFTDSVWPHLKLTDNLELNWLTILSLRDHRPRDFTEWIKLCHLKNLAALWVESDGPDGNNLNEFVVKEWAERSKIGEGFLNLKFLRIKRRGRLDTDVLMCLKHFPVLRVFYYTSPDEYTDLAKLTGHRHWISKIESPLCLSLVALNLHLHTNRCTGAHLALMVMDMPNPADREFLSRMKDKVPKLLVEGIAENAAQWVRNERAAKPALDTWFERRPPETDFDGVKQRNDGSKRLRMRNDKKNSNLLFEMMK